MNFHVNIFKNFKDMDCTNVVSLKSVLSAIKDGRWKDMIIPIREEKSKEVRDNLKKNLPAVIFCGVFEERLDEACVHYNHLMIVDIDKIDKKTLDALKSKLRHNIYVLAFFESPSGGLKILIPVDSDQTFHNNAAFFTIEDMFMDSYGIKIDPSGKNLSRLCFISYDPEMYVNYECMVLHIDLEYKVDNFETISSGFPAGKFVPEYDASKIFEVAVKMTKASKTGSYRKGNRNKYIFCLACLMCEFGVPCEQALSLIFERYNTLGWKECKTTVFSAFRKNHLKFATKEINSRNSGIQQSLF